MTSPPLHPALQPATAPDAGAEAWAHARAMGDIQFAPLQPVPVPRNEPPAWLRAAMDWLAARIGPLGAWLAQHWRMIEIGGAVLLVVALCWFGWKLWQDRQRIPRRTDEAPAWAPDAAVAAILLADSDRLAAEGRFDEAVHLLLRRSFDDIAANRPELLTPASTAREIAQGPVLPAPARSAFGVIAQEVERSRYALNPLRRDDWLRARAAYAAFAVPGRGTAGAPA